MASANMALFQTRARGGGQFDCFFPVGFLLTPPETDPNSKRRGTPHATHARALERVAGLHGGLRLGLLDVAPLAALADLPVLNAQMGVEPEAEARLLRESHPHGCDVFS